jgi:hypothetical protein
MDKIPNPGNSEENDSLSLVSASINYSYVKFVGSVVRQAPAHVTVWITRDLSGPASRSHGVTVSRLCNAFTSKRNGTHSSTQNVRVQKHSVTCPR